MTNPNPTSPLSRLLCVAFIEAVIASNPDLKPVSTFLPTGDSAQPDEPVNAVYALRVASKSADVIAFTNNYPLALATKRMHGYLGVNDKIDTGHDLTKLNKDDIVFLDKDWNVLAIRAVIDTKAQEAAKPGTKNSRGAGSMGGDRALRMM